MAGVLKTVACLSLILIIAGTSHGAALLTNSGPPAIVTNPEGGTYGLDQVAGYSFTVGTAALDVTSLGFWDYEQNGLPAALHIALWDNQTNAMLASATVPSGVAGRLEGEFRYADLASAVRIEAGKTYTLGYRKTHASSAGMVQGKTIASPTVSPGVTIAMGRLRTPTLYFLAGTPSSITNQFPQYPIAPLADQRPTQDLAGGGTVIVGPNLLYTVVPEPATLALLALAPLAFLRPQAIR